MCSPLVMGRVQGAVSRRRLVGAAAAGGAAALLAGLAPATGTARQATPGASPVASPGASPVASPIAAVLPGGFTAVRDLTHVITPAFPVFPGYIQFERTELATIAADGFYANELRLAEHTGTHLDAPGHFAEGAPTAELLPIERFVAPLAVVDISERAASDDDAALTVDDLLAWEAEHGAIPAGALVAMFSGWETRLADPAVFLNADASGALHFPGIDPEAAAFLVEERDIVGVGVDTLSIDIGASTDYGTHVTVLGAEKYGVENLANLADVPPVGATIIVGGPKHEAGSGGPARVLALY